MVRIVVRRKRHVYGVRLTCEDAMDQRPSDVTCSRRRSSGSSSIDALSFSLLKSLDLMVWWSNKRFTSKNIERIGDHRQDHHGSITPSRGPALKLQPPCASSMRPTPEVWPATQVSLNPMRRLAVNG